MRAGERLTPLNSRRLAPKPDGRRGDSDASLCYEQRIISELAEVGISMRRAIHLLVCLLLVHCLGCTFRPQIGMTKEKVSSHSVFTFHCDLVPTEHQGDVSIFRHNPKCGTHQYSNNYYYFRDNLLIDIKTSQQVQEEYEKVWKEQQIAQEHEADRRRKQEEQRRLEEAKFCEISAGEDFASSTFTYEGMQAKIEDGQLTEVQRARLINCYLAKPVRWQGWIGDVQSHPLFGYRALVNLTRLGDLATALLSVTVPDLIVNVDAPLAMSLQKNDPVCITGVIDDIDPREIPPISLRNISLQKGRCEDDQ